MRIFWWQLGLHIEPETHEENIFLEKCHDFLQNIKFDDGIDTRPGSGVVKADNEQPVVRSGKMS